MHVLKEIRVPDHLTPRDGKVPLEAELLAEQEHPFILKLTETMCDPPSGQLCIVTEFCDRGDLHSLLAEIRRRGETVPEPQLLTWLVQLCLALAHLHRQVSRTANTSFFCQAPPTGFVGPRLPCRPAAPSRRGAPDDCSLAPQRILHRDIKTSNIFVAADSTLKLGDFGLAKFLARDGNAEAVQSRVGSPFYLSPEICNNHPYGTESDVWSLGVTRGPGPRPSLIPRPSLPPSPYLPPSFPVPASFPVPPCALGLCDAPRHHLMVRRLTGPDGATCWCAGTRLCTRQAACCTSWCVCGLRSTRRTWQRSFSSFAAPRIRRFQRASARMGCATSSPFQPQLHGACGRISPSALSTTLPFLL